MSLMSFMDTNIMRFAHSANTLWTAMAQIQHFPYALP